jgi:hypothetical protein
VEGRHVFISPFITPLEWVGLGFFNTLMREAGKTVVRIESNSLERQAVALSGQSRIATKKIDDPVACMAACAAGTIARDSIDPYMHIS